MPSEDQLAEMYNALLHCSSGNCNGCPRYSNLNGSNTYPCVHKLLTDCKDIVGWLLEKE